MAEHSPTTTSRRRALSTLASILSISPLLPFANAMPRTRTVLRLRGGTHHEHAARIHELESRVHHFLKQLGDISDHKAWDEFFTIIHRPGWTTPAELAFAMGAAENLEAMAVVMAKAKQSLIGSSQLVGGEEGATSS